LDDFILLINLKGTSGSLDFFIFNCCFVYVFISSHSLQALEFLHVCVIEPILSLFYSSVFLLSNIAEGIMCCISFNEICDVYIKFYLVLISCSSSLRGLKMFKNTFQSGFLSILYSLGYVVLLFLYLNSYYNFHTEALPSFDVTGANLCRYGIRKVSGFSRCWCIIFRAFLRVASC
jgi:hypothetical protein